MSWLRRAGLLAIATLVAASSFVAVTLPPAATPLTDIPATTLVVPGAIHVHSTDSDGSGTREEIARAAGRAGLAFVVMTDHGDGRRVPPAPAYIEGVLVLSGVEISTSGGHYLALDMPQTPYPLGGEARDVVDDVRRFGGFGVAAHPGSVKSELRWREWGTPFDGLEWLNADSEWRDESRSKLVRAFLDYFFRPPQAVASLMDRPGAILARWDALTRRRHIVATAGHDAHAGIGWRRDHPADGGGGVFLRMPSYESAFRAFTVRVELSRGFDKNANHDARLVLDALRAGHLFTAIDSVAAPPRFELAGESGGVVAHEGDDLSINGPITLRVRVNAPDGVRIVLFGDGRALRDLGGRELAYEAPRRRSTYRVEVRLPQAPGRPPVPWIVSNPIYVGGVSAPAAGPGPVRDAPVAERLASVDRWRVEKDNQSVATLETFRSPPGWTSRFTLAPGPRGNQYVAWASFDAETLRDHDRVSFSARADRPLRVSVQLRTPDAQRWQRSIYVDRIPRTVTVFFDDMRPIADSRPRPVLAKVDALLFVVDTRNAESGMTGTLRVENVRYER